MLTFVTWRTCKRTLLLFWAVWLSIVVASNLADASRAAGLLEASFPFASGNYATILEVTSPAELPNWVSAGLFAGVILWEAVSMVLFLDRHADLSESWPREVAAADLYGWVGFVGGVSNRLRGAPIATGVPTGRHAPAAIHRAIGDATCDYVVAG